MRVQGLLGVLVLSAACAGRVVDGGVELIAESPPVVVFSPLPPLPEGSSLPFNQGSEDFYALFEPDALWQEAAERVEVFRIYSSYGRAYATDAQLATVIEGVRQRGMQLAVEVGPLPYPPEHICVGREGYGGPFEIELLRRIHGLGGTVDQLAFDEPYAFGHRADGPEHCQWPMESVASATAAFVRAAREVFPAIVAGDIEPLWARPRITADDLGAWMDAYRVAAGEPLGFVHLDVDWRRPDWPDALADAAVAVRARGVPVGVIYNGWPATTDDGWAQLAAERIFVHEQQTGVGPDHVVLQSWFDNPRRVLPETDPSTFTGLVNRYFGKRTTIALTSDAGVLRASGGEPVGGATVTLTGTAVLPPPFQELPWLPGAVDPSAIALGTTTTGADGSFPVPVPGLPPGSYLLRAAYAGGLDHWPAYADHPLLVE